MNKPTCIYCKKTSTESGLMQMTVDAPGIYYQCYDVRNEGEKMFCVENGQLVMPNGKNYETKKQ